MAKSTQTSPRSRAVIVAGVRTPFVRAFGPYTTLDTIALAERVVRGLLERTNLDRKSVEGIIWGGVILPATSPNIGREVVLDLGLPPEAHAHTVTRACASGLQAITDAAALIDRGEADIVIAGGSDSTSNVGVSLPAEVIHAFAPLALGKQAGIKDVVDAARKLWPFNNILPRRPQIAERSTGELMGESAERMAELNAISREAQDRLALDSHRKAAKAYDDGILTEEVIAVDTPSGRVERDGLLRADTTIEKLAKLGPVFKQGGTLTAGNSTALTDGAAAVLMMSEDTARALGYTPLARLRSWSYVGVDPRDQLLIGPAIAMPQALDRAGLQLSDIDLVDIHEAFAAQVLSVLKALESDTFARERLGRDKAVGAVDPARFNVHGGSLALGHPFGATGARMVTTMARELHRSGKQTALLGICAAGGLGAAAVLERAD
jgi:acetyl-CoA acyltransferase